MSNGYIKEGVLFNTSSNLMKLDKDELLYLIEDIKNIRGRHTELVSIYVPAGHNINEIKDMVGKEISTAENIKSKTTRNNVIAALSKISNALKFYSTTPKNGLVIFAGNVSQKEGEQNIKIWEIEPPEPINIKLYRCDQTFILGPLEEILESKEIYGLISLDRQEAGIGFLKGKRIEVVKRIESLVPGKTAKGGQSAARFMRVREGLLNAYLKELGENVKNIFNNIELQGILIGGPGPLKQEFYEGNYLPENLKRKVIGIVDTGYAGEPGLKELVERAEEYLKESEYLKEKKIVDEFFKLLNKDEKMVVYGFSQTLSALEQGAIDKLLISGKADFKGFKCLCNDCKNEFIELMRKEENKKVKCKVCDSENVSCDEVHYIKLLKERAKLFGTEVYIISDETIEGMQFKMFSGIGGVLRYKI